MPSERPSSGQSSMKWRSSNKLGSDDEAFYEECKSAYLSTISSVGDRILKKNDLYSILVNAGRSPSLDSMATHWPDEGYLSFTQFCQVMRNEKIPEKHEITELFHQLDARDEGLLSEQQLSSFLSQHGEKMTPGELGDIFAAFSDCKREGKYDYLKIASRIAALQTSTATQCGIKISMDTHKISSSHSLVNEKLVKKMQSKIEPKKLNKWECQPRNGYMVFHDNGSSLKLTSYKLTLSESSNVFITVDTRGILNYPKPNIDVMFLCVKLNSDGNLTEKMYLSNLTDGQRCCLNEDLPSGSYRVMPFTFSNDFLPRKSQPRRAELLEGPKSEDARLTDTCQSALKSLLNLIDVDDDNSLSRTELNLFQVTCTNEPLSDEDWKTLVDSFDTVDGCVTASGFLDFSRMEAMDDEAGLVNTFESMGFNVGLVMDENCPIRFEFYCDKHDVMTVDLDQKCSTLETVTSKLTELSKKKEAKVKQYDNVSVNTYKSDQVGIIVVENTGKSTSKARLDLSKSSNVKLASDFKNVSVQSKSSKVAQICLPKDPSKDMVIKMAVNVD